MLGPRKITHIACSIYTAFTTSARGICHLHRARSGRQCASEGSIDRLLAEYTLNSQIEMGDEEPQYLSAFILKRRQRMRIEQLKHNTLETAFFMPDAIEGPSRELNERQ